MHILSTDDAKLGEAAALALLPSGAVDWPFWVHKVMRAGLADFSADSPATVAHTAAVLWQRETGADGAAAWIDELQAIATGREPEPSGRPLLFVRAGELVRLPAKVDWLFRDLLEREALALLFGDPGAGKSFAALGMAACAATGTPWHGHRVKSGPVAYIAGEGHAGVARRLKGWEVHHGVSLKDAPLFVSRRAVPMLDADAVDALVHELDHLPARPLLVIVDTMARSMGGGEENSAADVGAFVAACDRLRERYGATVLIIHHAGHGDKSRARGSSALRAAVDVEMGLCRAGDNDAVLVLSCSKAKDSEPFPPVYFSLRTVDLPWADDEGHPINSAVLVPADYEPAEGSATATKGAGIHQKQALGILRQLLNEHRARLEASGYSPSSARVTLSDWREAMKAADMPRQRVKDVPETLIKNGRVVLEGNHVSPA